MRSVPDPKSTKFLLVVFSKLSSMHYGNAVYRELGIELLRLVPGTEAAVARLCARCAASMSEINRLHQLVSYHFLSFCNSFL